MKRMIFVSGCLNFFYYLVTLLITFLQYNLMNVSIEYYNKYIFIIQTIPLLQLLMVFLFIFISNVVMKKYEAFDKTRYFLFAFGWSIIYTVIIVFSFNGYSSFEKNEFGYYLSAYTLISFGFSLIFVLLSIIYLIIDNCKKRRNPYEYIGQQNDDIYTSRNQEND